MNIQYLSLILITCATHTIFSVPLRDGSDIPQERVDEVWNKLQDYSQRAAQDNGHCWNALWKATRIPNANVQNFNGFKHCVTAGLFNQDGNIDELTRHIIQSSYVGGMEPKFYDMVYPVNTFRHRTARKLHWLTGFSYLSQARKAANEKN